MVNWFPMALKDGARSWLMHLPEGSISSWHELRKRFIANFQEIRDHALTINDLRRVSNIRARPSASTFNDDLYSALELFNLVDKCAKAEEGHLSLLKHPEVHPEDKKAKAKEVKRKGPTVLAAEPELKRNRDCDDPPMDAHPLYVFHNVHTHNTDDCQELKALRDERLGCRPERSDCCFGHGGGHGGGCWDSCNPC
jgi:hypothetical protein